MNARLLSVLLSLSFTLMASPVMAAPESVGKGFAFGVRAGYGEAFGSFLEDDGERNGVREVVSGLIPAQVDVGYFLSERLYVGGFFQYGVGFITDICGRMDCSGRDLRFGVDVTYHLLRPGTVNPWLGLGAGYEILSVSLSNDLVDESLTISHSGFEFAHAQAGVDFHIGGPVWLGPCVTFTAGQFSTVSASVGDRSTSTDIDDQTFHFWLMSGARLLVRL